MKVNCQLIAGGCNTVYSGFQLIHDQADRPIVAYPCANQILIQDVALVKVTCSLSNFAKRVNSVKLFTNQNGLHVVGVSGDGVLAIYRQQGSEWQLQNKATLSTESIQVVHVVDNYFITLGIDGRVSVISPELVIVSSIEFGKNVMECVDTFSLGQSIVVSLSGVDSLIHLYELYQHSLRYLTSMKGHQRSVNTLKFAQLGADTILLSGGKDNYVRLWKFYSEQDALQQLQPENAKGVKELKLAGSRVFKVKLESVLQGHNEEVSSIAYGLCSEQVQGESEYFIASASFDYNIIIWKQDIESGLWMMKSRVGQTSGNKNQLFGVQVSRKLLLASTYVGALFLWEQNKQEWVELPTPSGHFSYVTDLDFSSKGYLVSCSQDQTTRVWARWVVNNTWNEMARPQIHGYDLTAVKFLKTSDREVESLISGGDEKILRLFTPTPLTANFLNTLASLDLKIRNAQLEPQSEESKQQIRLYKVSQEGIQQPLGLMNKQIEVPDEEGEPIPAAKEEENPLLTKSNINYQQPPSDSLLTVRGLWPELNKMYGHGYEIAAIDTFGTIAASSCRSTSEDAAKIIIWDTTKFRILQQLTAHSYTVVQLQFSPSGRFLASVSKDRTLSLFESIDGKFTLVQRSQPCARIVYACDFFSDESHIVTGSRDKKIRIYTVPKLDLVGEFNVGIAVSAVSTLMVKDQRIIVAGLETGQIYIYRMSADYALHEIGSIERSLIPNGQINRILTRGDGNFMVACCSDDHTVRIYDVQLI